MLFSVIQNYYNYSELLSLFRIIGVKFHDLLILLFFTFQIKSTLTRPGIHEIREVGMVFG